MARQIAQGGKWVEDGTTPLAAVQAVITLAKADLARIGAILKGLWPMEITGVVVEVDEVRRVAYVRLTPEEHRRIAVAKSIRVTSSVVLDFDVAGVLIGVEILDLPGFPITWPVSTGRKE